MSIVDSISFLVLIVSCIHQDLRDAFSQFGEVVNVSIPVERETQKKRGFAFVEFVDSDSADKAALQGELMIQDNRVDVKKARDKNEMSRRGGRGGGTGGWGGGRDSYSQGGSGGWGGKKTVKVLCTTLNGRLHLFLVKFISCFAGLLRCVFLVKILIVTDFLNFAEHFR